jgi:hypothetical protein
MHVGYPAWPNLGGLARSIHRRCQDPIKTLLALQALLPALLSRVADDLFLAELHALREQLPPTQQSQFKLSIWKHVLPLSPTHKLHLLRTLQRKIEPSDAAPSPATPPAAPGHERQAAPDGPVPAD